MTTISSEKMNSGHALLLPYPSQGHINPMLQFGKRIFSHGLRATAAISRFIAATTKPDADQVAIETISDGFDEDGFAAAQSISAYVTALESAGSRTLDELLRSLAERGRPVTMVVYDSFLPWAVGVARRHGVAAAAFFTQSAAVNLIYCHLWEGRLKYPVEEAALEQLPGLPRMEPDELPSFLSVHAAPYAAYFELLQNQYKCLEMADFMLINSFYELEPREMNYFMSTRAARMIGPTLPSAYWDDRIPGESTYAIQLYPPETEACRSWAAALKPSSAVFISFGSMAELSADQTVELAFGLAATGRPFLWVVRSSEKKKLPPGIVAEVEKKGSLVVGWAPQLEILDSGRIGCFVTHCGWNSTMEALALGVPMVGLPQWTDQPTNAKYIEEVWGVGLRARKGEGGLVMREEVERCIMEVMEGARSDEIRGRAAGWKEAAIKAVSAGGSSDLNIAEFLAKV